MNVATQQFPPIWIDGTPVAQNVAYGFIAGWAHVVYFGDVAGYMRTAPNPNPIVVMVVAGQTETVTGSYVPVSPTETPTITLTPTASGTATFTFGSCCGVMTCQPSPVAQSPTPTPYAGSRTTVSWGTVHCAELAYFETWPAVCGLNFGGGYRTSACPNGDVMIHGMANCGGAVGEWTACTGGGVVDMGVVPFSDASMQAPPSSSGAYVTSVCMYDQHSYFLLAPSAGNNAYARVRVMCADTTATGYNETVMLMWQLGQ